MPLYEHVFLSRQDVSSQQVETLTEAFKSIIEEGGGKISKSEYWGLKTLTYRIKKNRKAHFSLFNIEAPHPAVAEMERQMNLNDDVIRFLTLKMDELEEGPSTMMQSRGGRDDDRRPPRRDNRSFGSDRPAPSDNKPTTADSGDKDDQPSKDNKKIEEAE